MIKRDIDIINECWKDIAKFNKIISFNSASATMKAALVLRKYHLWYLKHKLKINVQVGKEKDLFIKIIDECEDNEKQIELNYCLGELYYLENNEKALECFKFVEENYRDNYQVDKNLFHMCKSILNSEEKVSLEDDIICYESKYFKFKSIDKEIFNDDYVEDALWLSRKCANYKDTMDLICNYLRKHKGFEELSLALLNAYETTKNTTYIEDLISSISEIEDLDFELSEKVLESLHSIKEIDLWSRLLITFYKKVDKPNIDKILMNVDIMLGNTSLYTNEYLGETSVIDLLVILYDDITKLKGKYDFMEKYEKNISKYLLYSSYQNNCIPELYESYGKLKSIKNISSDILGSEELSILDCINEINIPNKEELEYINEYPFECIINNLMFILEDTKMLEELQDKIVYAANKENPKEALKYIDELIQLSKVELEKYKNDKNEVFNYRMKRIENILTMTQELKEKNVNMLDRYCNHVEKTIENFKKNINVFIVESIARIYSEVLDYVREITDAETIYDEVQTKLKNDINDWGRGAYNNFLKENIYMLLEDISNYIINENNIINNQVIELKNLCENICEFEEQFLYERLELEDLMKTLSNNSWMLLQYMYINIDEMIRKNKSFNMGIQKPRLSIGTGLSKLFNQEDELLNRTKQHIHDNIQESAKKAIAFIQNNIENIDILVESIRNIIFEDTYSIEEKVERQLVLRGCSIKPVSNNIQSIKDYCEDIDTVEQNVIDIESYIKERNLENIKVTEEKFIELDKLNIEISKYEDQISNGVIYNNRKLYRV